MFELQPTLKGELLELRPLCEDDHAELYTVASDPLIWEQHPFNDLFEEDVFKEYLRMVNETGGALVAIDRVNGKMIGSSRYFGYDERKSVVEISGTFLARSHWGGKYNAEMKQLMLDYAFQFVDSVVFLVGPKNIRSQRAVEKIGGVRDGSRLSATGIESLVYRIDKASLSIIN